MFLDSLDPGVCIDEAGAPASLEDSLNLHYFLEVMRRFGFEGRYGLLCGGSRTIGLSRAEILARVSASSALVNIMGFLKDEEVLAAAPKRIFLDIDPGFGQMWQALGLHDAFSGHDAFVTIAEAMGTPSCSIPTCGLAWITTRQPVVLDHWTAADPADGDGAITSVASWRGAYGPIAYRGTTYGLRVHEFRKFAELPDLAARRFEIALDISSADLKDIELLRGHGWSLIEPQLAAGDPWRYHDYIRRSAAELMIAKGMYVADAQRLVQRSQHLLSRQRPSRHRAGHRVQRNAADRRRAACVSDTRPGGRCRTRGRARLPPPRARRPPARRNLLRFIQRAQHARWKVEPVLRRLCR